MFHLLKPFKLISIWRTSLLLREGRRIVWDVLLTGHQGPTPFLIPFFSFFLLSFGCLKCRVKKKILKKNENWIRKWIFASLSPTRAKHLCYKRCFLYLVPKPKTLRQFYCLHSVVFDSKIEEINKEVKSEDPLDKTWGTLL